MHTQPTGDLTLSYALGLTLNYFCLFGLELNRVLNRWFNFQQRGSITPGQFHKPHPTSLELNYTTKGIVTFKS